MRTIVCFLLLALTSYSLENAAPSATSCSYYQYLEQRWQCSQTEHSYPVDYGLKYCSIFLEVAETASAQLKTFLHNTAFCLQKTLEQFDLRNEPRSERCKELEILAFGSHSACYQEHGFHELKTRDQLKVTRRIMNLDMLLKPRFSFTQGMEIGLLCASNKVRNRNCLVQ